MNLAQFLCDELSVIPDQLNRFLSAAPNKYKVYAIPKRTSGKRIIAHPAKELKKYQRKAVEHLETVFKVHSCAYAYRKGLGIKANAECHVNSRYLLKMDFQDFFHSISDKFFFEMCDSMNISFSKEDKRILTHLLFWRPSKKVSGKLTLSVGAPSSPFISNAMMYLFDEALYSECKNQGVTYSRYADDLTFSSNVKGVLFQTPDLVRSLLVSKLMGYISINEAKTVFTSKAHNRHITGVTLTNDSTISLGRKRKRYISSLIHKYSLGQLPEDDVLYLQGLLAFASDIEPDFIDRMQIKYSKSLVCELRGKMI